MAGKIPELLPGGGIEEKGELSEEGLNLLQGEAGNFPEGLRRVLERLGNFLESSEFPMLLRETLKMLGLGRSHVLEKSGKRTLKEASSMGRWCQECV